MDAFDKPVHEEELFKGIVFSGMEISGKEFDGCRFVECNFTEADLGRCQFDNCSFETCNLSNPKIGGARLINVGFSQCKLTGINFYQCDQTVFDMTFDGCKLINCNFSDLKMKRTKFVDCDVLGCFFQNTFLVEAVFDRSTFRETLFSGCDIQRASFFDAKGYSIDPRNNKIRKAIFSVPDVLSLIDCFDIVIKDK